MKGYLILGILIASLLKVAYDFDTFKTLSTIETYSDCKYLDTDIIGPEDMTHYKNGIIFVSSGDYAKLWSKGAPINEQLGIYAIINSHKPNFQVKKLKINGFPKDIAFYAHGITIQYKKDGDYLYVINHAYHNGGERVEILRIIQEDLSLHYMHSIIMDPKYNGVLNDLIVVGDHRLIATKYIPYPDPIEGRQFQSGFEKLKIMTMWTTKMRYSYLIDCDFDTSTQIIQPKCRELLNTNTVMVNGMTWDYKDRVWAAEPFLKGIMEYKLTPKGLDIVRLIEIGSSSDNVEYDKQTDSLIIGMIPQFYNYVLLDDFLKNNTLTRQTQFNYWSAIGRYDLKQEKLEVLAQGQNLSKGTAGGYVSGENLFIGSWCDITVMVCKKNE